MSLFAVNFWDVGTLCLLTNHLGSRAGIHQGPVIRSGVVFCLGETGMRSGCFLRILSASSTRFSARWERSKYG